VSHETSLSCFFDSKYVGRSRWTKLRQRQIVVRMQAPHREARGP
jgi:hypothetical protein